MHSMRNLLSQEPMTFNELLNLFEACVSTIGEPIRKGYDMLREEVGWGEHAALGHVFGVACDAEDMAKRIGQIRAARNAGTDVTITMTRGDAFRLEHAIREIGCMLSAAGSTFELLHDRAAPDTDNEDAGARVVMALAQRALMDTDKRDVAGLRRFAARLLKESQYQHIDQEEAA